MFTSVAEVAKNGLKLPSKGSVENTIGRVSDNELGSTISSLLSLLSSELSLSAKAYEDIGFAYEDAVSRGKLTVICGSLYLYSDLYEHLNKN